jgi:hypothetical protein
MNPKTIFGLAIRIVGLIITLYGLDWLARFAMGQMGYFTLKSTDMGYYLLMAIGYIGVGFYLLRGAPHFVRYAYPDDDPDIPDALEEVDPEEIVSD